MSMLLDNYVVYKCANENNEHNKIRRNQTLAYSVRNSRKKNRTNSLAFSSIGAVLWTREKNEQPLCFSFSRDPILSFSDRCQLWWSVYYMLCARIGACWCVIKLIIYFMNKSRSVRIWHGPRQSGKNAFFLNCFAFFCFSVTQCNNKLIPNQNSLDLIQCNQLKFKAISMRKCFLLYQKKEERISRYSSAPPIGPISVRCPFLVSFVVSESRQWYCCNHNTLSRNYV